MLDGQAVLRFDVIEASIYEDLFGLVPSKGQQRMVQIAEGAIKTYVRLGIEKSTFAHISKASRLSRPQILNYFPDYEQLFLFVSRYVRARLQRFVIEEMMTQANADEKLRTYILACFRWCDEVRRLGALREEHLTDSQGEDRLHRRQLYLVVSG